MALALRRAVPEAVARAASDGDEGRRSWLNRCDQVVAQRGTVWGMGAEVVTTAGIQALSGLYPGWRIWADNDTSWHAYRRGGYVQQCSDGAPAFSVHAGSPAELAGMLFWQDAVDAYGPFACSGM